MSRYPAEEDQPSGRLTRNTEERALIFAPLALLRDHALLEAAIAGLFVSGGALVEVVRCSRDFVGGCALHVGKQSSSLEAICRQCVSSSESLDVKPRYEVSKISQVKLSPEQETHISTLSKLSNEELVDHQVDAIPLGRFWSYDLALHHKNPEILQKEDVREDLLHAASSGLKAYFSAKNKIQQFQPTSVLVYSQEYGVNRCFAAAARRVGIPVLNVHHRGTLPDRFGSFSVSLKDKADKPITKARFNESMRLPVLPEEAVEIAEHFKEIYRSKAHMVYSRARGNLSALEVRQQMGLRDGRVVLIASSSPDEPLAAVAAKLFPDDLAQVDELEGIKEMLALVQLSRETDFIFRLHPRLLPNHRDQVTSPAASRILELVMDLEKTSPNLFLSLPSDNVGLYDLALVCDVVLTQRSSAAHELGILGIPAIYTDETADPVRALRNFAAPWQSRKTLAAQLQSALDHGFAANQAIAHMRYAASALIRLVIHVESREKGSEHRRGLIKILKHQLHRAGVFAPKYESVDDWVLDGRNVLEGGMLPSQAVEEWPWSLHYPASSAFEPSSTSERELLWAFLELVRPVFGVVGKQAGVAFSMVE